MADAHQPPVRRRKIFYISGFDPKGPAYYHALYSEQAAKSAALDGSVIEVGPARRQGRHATHWQIEADTAGVRTRTDYEFLRWDDIMRARMKQGGPGFFMQAFATYLLFVRTGALWQILKASYPAFLSGLYPMGVMLFFSLAGCAAAAIIFFAAGHLGHMAGLDGIGRWAPAALASLAGFYGAFRIARWLETRLPWMWTLHVYNFAADHMRGRAPETDARIADFIMVEWVEDSIRRRARAEERRQTACSASIATTPVLFALLRVT